MVSLPLTENEIIRGALSTSGDGAADGSTVVASTMGGNNGDFVGMTIEVMASTTARLVGERREVTGYASATGTFTVDPFFPVQVPTASVIQVRKGRPSTSGEAGAIIALTGTADAGSDADTLRDAALTHADDYWNGMVVVMLSGANAGLSRVVEDFVAATDDLQLLDPFPAAIAAGDLYAIVSLSHRVPPADDTAGAVFEQVIGSKADAAVQAVGAVASLVGIAKALKTNQGDPSAHTLTTWTAKWGNLDQSFAAWAGSQVGHVFTSIAAKLGNLPATLTAILGNPTGDTLTSLAAKWGNNAQSFAAWTGDMSAHALTSMAAKWGNMTETLLVVLGARADAAIQTQVDASIHGRLKGILLAVANPTIISATFSYADAAGQQTIFTASPAAGQVWAIDYMEFDVNALTQNATLRVQKRIDGASWRTVADLTVLSTDEGAFDRVYYADNTSQLRVTIERAAVEGAARDIPYRYYYRRLA